VAAGAAVVRACPGACTRSGREAVGIPGQGTGSRATGNACAVGVAGSRPRSRDRSRKPQELIRGAPQGVLVFPPVGGAKPPETPQM